MFLCVCLCLCVLCSLRALKIEPVVHGGDTGGELPVCPHSTPQSSSRGSTPLKKPFCSSYLPQPATLPAERKGRKERSAQKVCHPSPSNAVYISGWPGEQKLFISLLVRGAEAGPVTSQALTNSTAHSTWTLTLTCPFCTSFQISFASNIPRKAHTHPHAHA